MDEFQKYFARVLKYLNYRPRSEKEIRDYLKKKNTDSLITQRIISLLKEQRFLNDKEFARMWVSSRTRFNVKSKRVITMELKQKGIDQDLIEQAFNQEEVQNISDFDLAKQLAEKRANRLKNLPVEERKKKLAGFLGRKGFGWDTIKKVLELDLIE